MISTIARKRGLMTLKEMALACDLPYQTFYSNAYTARILPTPSVMIGKRKYYTVDQVKTIKGIIAGKE